MLLLGGLVACSTGLLKAEETPFTLVWNTASFDPGTSEDPNPLPGVSSSGLITPISVIRGPGINWTTLNNAFSSNNWDTTTGGEYFEFGFIVEEGYQVTLDEAFFGLRATNTGPGFIDLVADTDGEGFGSALDTYTMVGGSWVNVTTSFNTLENLTGTVLFRFVKANETSANDGSIAAGGTFALGRFQPGDGLVPSGFGGTVSVIPEPLLLGGIFSGCLLVLAVWRRRRRVV